MTGFLTKEQIENWTAEDEFIFNFHLLLTSHPYFTKRTPERIKKLDIKMRMLLAEFYTNKSFPLEQQVSLASAPQEAVLLAEDVDLKNYITNILENSIKLIEDNIYLRGRFDELRIKISDLSVNDMKDEKGFEEAIEEILKLF